MIMDLAMLQSFLKANKVTIDELAEFIEKVRRRKQKRREHNRYDRTINAYADEIGSDLFHAATLINGSFIEKFDSVGDNSKLYLFFYIRWLLRSLVELKTKNAKMDKNNTGIINSLDTNTEL